MSFGQHRADPQALECEVADLKEQLVAAQTEVADLKARIVRMQAAGWVGDLAEADPPIIP